MTIHLPKYLLVLLLSLTVFCANSQAVWKQYNGPFSGEISNFVSYGDTLIGGATNTGIFKSVDGGENWNSAIPEITGVLCLYNLNTTLLIGSDVLYEYSRAGKPLVQLGQKVPGAITNITEVDNDIFVTTGYEVYRYDGLMNQLLLRSNGLPVNSENQRWIMSLTALDNVLFCNLPELGVYKSADGGENWSKVNTPTAAYTLVRHEDLLLSGGFGSLNQSDDAGETWQDISFDLSPNNFTVNKTYIFNDKLFNSSAEGTNILPHGTTHWIKVGERSFESFYNHKGTLFASDKSGVYYWNESEQKFILSNKGINTSRVNEIELFNHKIYSATERGIHYTITDDDNWSVVSELAEDYSRALAEHDTILFAGTSNGLYSTSIHAPAWVKSETEMSAIWKIAVTSKNVYTATDNGVYVSATDGKSWRPLPNSTSSVSQMIFIGANDTILVAANTFGLYKILPDSTWEAVDFFKGKFMTSLNVVNGVVYATELNSPVYRSDDNCQTWSPVDITSRSEVDMIKRGDNIYAADFDKIYYSADNGFTWSYFYETGIPEILINSITEGDSAFYIGTYGKSIWRRPYLSDTNINSATYTIDGDVISNVSANTTLDEFKSKIEVSYGTSTEIERGDGSGGRISEIRLNNHDKLKIIAEDGKNTRILSLLIDNEITAVSDEEQTWLQVFPNPAKDKLMIEATAEIELFTIVNSVGQVMTSPKLVANYINIKELPAGLYFLITLDKSNNKKVAKFIKEQ